MLPSGQGGGDAMIASDVSIRRWIVKYEAYQQVCSAMDVGPDRPEIAQKFALASWGVASAWRELATTPGLPWWVVAAVDTSAEAFEEQARTWTAHAERLGSA